MPGFEYYLRGIREMRAKNMMPKVPLATTDWQDHNSGKSLLEPGEAGHGCLNTGAWPAPDWNLDPRHKVFTDEELKRIKDFFPKHKGVK